MKAYRSSNNFTDKISVEPALDSILNLVDKCLNSAQSRPDLKAEPPAEAWFDIESDNFLLTVGMRSIESNYVYLREGAPEEPQPEAKGVFGFLKAFTKAMSRKEGITADLSKDQIVAFLPIVLADDLEKIVSFLQPYTL